MLSKKNWIKLKRFQKPINFKSAESQHFVITCTEESTNIVLFLECDFGVPQFDDPDEMKFIRVFALEDSASLVQTINHLSLQSTGLCKVKVLSLADIGVNFKFFTRNNQRVQLP